MTEIDRIQYGQLIASVDHLTRSLDKAVDKIALLERRLDAVDGQFRFGKGALLGLIFAAGAAGLGLREMISGLFGR